MPVEAATIPERRPVASTRRRRARGDEGEAWRELSSPAKAGLYAILVFLSILMLFPFVWMVSTALRPAGYETLQTLIPEPYLAFENFGKAWNYRGTFFTQWLINSIVISVVATFMSVVLNALSGFAFAKYTFPGRNFLFLCVIATMMVPFQVVMIPVYVVIANLGLANNYWGVILPSTASAFGIFLMRQFMQSIPDELLDAARIDGASELRIFRQLIVPLTMPAVAVFAILHFLHMWNDYLLPLLVLSKRQLFTMQIGIVNFQGEYRAEWNLMMSMVIVSIIPPIAIFLVFQQYFVRGIAMTGMKG
jgi:ABC-type glycerol-3-phosphate transport system permease component